VENVKKCFDKSDYQSYIIFEDTSLNSVSGMCHKKKMKKQRNKQITENKKYISVVIQLFKTMKK